MTKPSRLGSAAQDTEGMFESIHDVKWNPAWSTSMLLAALKTAKEQSQKLDAETTVGLVLDGAFLNFYAQLDENAQNKIAEAIQMTSLTRVRFENCPDRSFLNPATEKLLGLMGSIATLTEVSLDMDELTARIPSLAIQKWKHLAMISIDWTESDHISDDCHWLAKGFANHPCLHSVKMDVPSYFYPYLLPALAEIPLLQHVRLFRKPGKGNIEYDAFEWGSDDDDDDDSEFDEDDRDYYDYSNATAMREIAKLSHAKPNLDYTLEYFDLTPEAAMSNLCVALSSERIQALSLSVCLIKDPTSLLQALENSTLERLQTTHLRFESASQAHSFFRDLGGTIVRMPKLRELDCGTSINDIDDHDMCGVFDDAIANVACKSAQCSSLRTLKIQPWFYSARMDQALAKCLSENGNLESLVISCMQKNDQTASQSPALLAALHTNYSLQSIAFESDVRAWDPDLVANAEMLVRLNRCGRSYIFQDPSNKRKGVGVLEGVKDDLDCLFTHLKENPLLCDGCGAGAKNFRAGTPTRASRKRKSRA